MTHASLTTSPDVPFLSIVVPCFNEQEGIAHLVERCRASAAAVFGNDYEIILIDDGSTDATWDAIRDEIAKCAAVTGIRLSRNFGHQIALTAGLAAVNGSVVLVIDADLQDRRSWSARCWNACGKPAPTWSTARGGAARARAGSRRSPPACSTACSSAPPTSSSPRIPATSG
ncbi:MAG: glycosyltransferase [Bradyrhizobiaceae bacterium]|nr:MAG: glycosyltransferase [Bradyrhizobiaceae bacterium]